MAINLPTELLRTFITVSDLGGYTRAAEMLNRTQPAISLQMRRLEGLLGVKLLNLEGRVLTLTEAGQTLAAYARQILHMNDEAVAHFHRLDNVGALKIGLPTDFALSYLQSSVSQFISKNANSEIEIVCDLSRNLVSKLHSDELTLIVALIPEDEQQYLVKAWQEQPIWVTAEGKSAHKKSPLPLVGHPEGCEYRNRMTKILHARDVAWRIAFTSPDVAAVQDAVLDGIGVSALTHATLSQGMRILSASDGFPPLETIRIGLFYKNSRLPQTGLELSNHIISSLNKSTDEFFTQSAHPKTA